MPKVLILSKIIIPQIVQPIIEANIASGINSTSPTLHNNFTYKKYPITKPNILNPILTNTVNTPKKAHNANPFMSKYTPSITNPILVVIVSIIVHIKNNSTISFISTHPSSH